MNEGHAALLLSPFLNKQWAMHNCVTQPSRIWASAAAVRVHDAHTGTGRATISFLSISCGRFSARIAQAF